MCFSNLIIHLNALFTYIQPCRLEPTPVTNQSNMLTRKSNVVASKNVDTEQLGKIFITLTDRIKYFIYFMEHLTVERPCLASTYCLNQHKLHKTLLLHESSQC